MSSSGFEDSTRGKGGGVEPFAELAGGVEDMAPGCRWIRGGIRDVVRRTEEKFLGGFEADHNRIMMPGSPLRQWLN
jgi:hypothetical protein